MKNYFHIPVMLKEIIELLNIKKGGQYIDGTLGGGGYTRAISQAIGERGKILSIDLDPLAIDNFSKDKLENVVVINDNFSNIKEVVLNNKKFLLKDKFDGIVVDLGLSSAQLEDDERGFSFQHDSNLDMSFGPQIENSTYWIVNNYQPSDLERIIKEYGEESWARKIAEHIVVYRKKKRIETTQELAEIIAGAIPRKFWAKRIHPATKTFQALRIETNQELESLKEFLPQAIELLDKGGRLVIVSFHSLEDRIVKNYFRDLGRSENPNIKILTPKPLIPGNQEIEENYRSRSAKLRAIEKI
ncbi:MAG TPA: 16S rRNA (cytosine(1402)-N(4))-methyltransferase RsmH [bacterium]|nr:16S rRNA (cytosine(1402)-N(4))-methyltransferase RsmH [bacterium]